VCEQRETEEAFIKKSSEIQPEWRVRCDAGDAGDTVTARWEERHCTVRLTACQISFLLSTFFLSFYLSSLFVLSLPSFLAFSFFLSIYLSIYLSIHPSTFLYFFLPLFLYFVPPFFLPLSPPFLYFFLCLLFLLFPFQEPW
jgi:hypothetical protein